MVTLDYAYFPDFSGQQGSVTDATRATYKYTDFNNNQGIKFYHQDAAGVNSAGYYIAIFSAKDKSNQQIKETIVHEVQHDADKHFEDKEAVDRIDGRSDPKFNAAVEALASSNRNTEPTAPEPPSLILQILTL